MSAAAITIAELAMRLPESERETNLVRKMASYGCLTRMHVVRLLAPPLGDDDHTKYIDFSRKGIRCRWTAGYGDARHVLAEPVGSRGRSDRGPLLARMPPGDRSNGG
jgi:Patatin phospholipase